MTQFIHLIPFFLFCILFIFTDKTRVYVYSRRLKLGTLLASLLLIVIPFFRLPATIHETIYESSTNNLYGATMTGVYDYYFYDLYHYLFPKAATVEAEEQAAIESFLSYYEEDSYVNPIDNQTYTVSNSSTGLASGKNLFIIQLEAINNFIIGLEMNGQVVMPNLTNLATHGLYYDEFYSTSGIGTLLIVNSRR
jgi:phosphoglycerol transferase MdoB-like AlkP superfamily enzyme